MTASGRKRLSSNTHASENPGGPLAGFLLAACAPVARDGVTSRRIAQNAVLLASLQLLRAEALQAEGRAGEADALRLDSPRWARYGFAADWAVHSKLREIATLGSARPPA